MKRRQTVIVPHDDLRQEVWTFYYLDNGGMVLDRWERQERATKRHKWHAHQYSGTVWTRLCQRDNRIERPTPTLDVVEQALNQFAESLYYGEAQ